MLLRQTAIYAVGNVLQVALAIGAVAVYTRLLTTVEYGSYSFVFTCVQFAFAFSVSWIATTIIRLHRGASDRHLFLGAILIYYVIVVILAAVGTGVAVVVLDTWQHRRLAMVGFLYFSAMSWMELNLRLFQARLEAARQTRSRVARSIISTVLGSALAWVGFGPEGILLGLAVGSLIPGLASNIREWRAVHFGGDARARLEIWHFGAPLALSFAVGAISAFAGRYLVSWLEGVAALGIFVLAFEIANRTASALLGPVGAASLPISVHELEKSGSEAARAMLHRACILLLGVLMPAGVGLAAVASDLVAVAVGPDFRAGAASILPYLAIAVFATGFQIWYLDFAFHLGLKSLLLIWRAGVKLVVNLAVNFALISRFGLLGAGYAAVGTTALSLTLTSILSRKAFPLPFPFRQFARIALATGCMVAVVLSVPGEPGLLRLLAKAAVGFIVYAVFAIVLNIGDVRQRATQFSARRLLYEGRLPR